MQEIKEFVGGGEPLATVPAAPPSAKKEVPEGEVKEVAESGNPASPSNPPNPASPVSLAKHPLQHAWTLWYKDNDPTKVWEENQHKITTFQTVEDFWCLYNHIKPPSEIKTGSDYSLFKDGIRPMWEDLANKQGGCWCLSSSKQATKSDIDAIWLDVLLCLIGESFENPEEICGAVITSRKYNKITIWTANAHNNMAVLRIGHSLKELLNLGNFNLTYHLHKDVMAKQGSTVKAIHTI